MKILFIILPFGFIILGGWIIIDFLRKTRKRIEMNKESTKKGWQYFTLSEVTKGMKGNPTSDQVANMDLLVKKVLDPLRQAYGKPINVGSGIRDYIPEGGSNTSDHLKGCAVDVEGFDYSNSENKKLAELLLSLNLPYTQLINEFGFSWLHIAYNPEDSRKRLTLSTGDRKKPTYTQVSSKTKFLI